MILVQKWFNRNKLSLNLGKTKFMVFTNQKCPEDISLNINGSLIERVSEFKFLGVFIDEKLKWKSHITYVKKKICKNIGVLSNVRFYLNYKALKILYCSLILPYFMYCLEVWGNCYSTHLSPLVILQKKAIRIINKVSPREHTTTLFQKSGLLKLKDLIALQTLVVMHKAKHNLLPRELQKLFALNSETSRRKLDFKPRHTRTTLKEKCLSVIGVIQWNSLETVQKCCSNIFQFKCKYKEKILKLYDNYL